MSSDWIEIDPEVCNGRPVLRGTRIAVQSVLEMLAAGDSVEDVLEAFPSLRREQVLACVDHAARLDGQPILARTGGMKGFLFDENLPRVPSLKPACRSPTRWISVRAPPTPGFGPTRNRTTWPSLPRTRTSRSASFWPSRHPGSSICVLATCAVAILPPGCNVFGPRLNPRLRPTSC